MIEMAAINNFSRARVSAGDCGGHNGPVARPHFGFDMGIQNNPLAAVQTSPKVFGRLPRNHKSKARRLTRR